VGDSLGFSDDGGESDSGEGDGWVEVKGGDTSDSS